MGGPIRLNFWDRSWSGVEKQNPFLSPKLYEDVLTLQSSGSFWCLRQAELNMVWALQRSQVRLQNRSQTISLAREVNLGGSFHSWNDPPIPIHGTSATKPARPRGESARLEYHDLLSLFELPGLCSCRRSWLVWSYDDGCGGKDMDFIQPCALISSFGFQISRN